MYYKYIKNIKLSKYDTSLDIWGLCLSFYTLANLIQPISDEYFKASKGIKGEEFPELPSHFSPEYKEMLQWGLKSDPL